MVCAYGCDGIPLYITLFTVIGCLIIFFIVYFIVYFIKKSQSQTEIEKNEQSKN